LHGGRLAERLGGPEARRGPRLRGDCTAPALSLRKIRGGVPVAVSLWHDRAVRNPDLSRDLPPGAAAPALSVVVTCYFEEPSIAEFHRRLSETLKALGRSYEIVFVNDGSTDGTLAALQEIFERDEHVAAVIDLFKNSGQAQAITAGVTFASGDALVFLDSDLQLDPEELPELLAEYDKGFDVVSGYRRVRYDSAWRRVASRAANTVMRRISKTKLRDFGCTFKIMNGKMIRAFDFGPFKPMRLPYLIAAAGRCSEIPVTHHPRPYGRSGWTLAKLFDYNIDNVVGLSQRPFQILSVLLLLAGALFAARVLISLVWPFSILDEVSNGLLLNAIVLGVLLTVGVAAGVGEYVMRSYLVLQGHPAYIVRDVRRRTVSVAPSRAPETPAEESVT
jgi:undecaprenyl-phosphate 4-deoxy-4-formamido-L-arabinose transferase